MGEIDIIAELRKDNPFAKQIDLEIFADAMKIYIEASENVRRNGAIVAHPRTGSPMENPYVKIQTQKGSVLSKYTRLNTDRVVQLLGQEGCSQ